MNITLYPKLAWTSMRKNRKLYLPYLLTCIGMIAMFYIIRSLCKAEVLTLMHGTETLRTLLGFGSGIIAVFSLLFMWYTHSFLIKRRKKEFGLYYVLGMSKKNLSLILLWESLIIALTSLLLGLFVGGLCYKFAELSLIKMLGGEPTTVLSLSWSSMGDALGIYGMIFVFLLIISLIGIRRTNAVDLMKSENAGEKPPKANWLFGLLGIALLIAAYVIAVTIEEPLSALAWFFLAVILVIVGTYCLFIASSVFVCRLLQKNKSYYYQPKHFVSVSSMAFRMKRNGAGLASICILATMVLVMICGTASLYYGLDDSLHARYPRDFNIAEAGATLEDLSKDHIAEIITPINDVLTKHNSPAQDAILFSAASVSGVFQGNTLIPDPDSGGLRFSYDNLRTVILIPLLDYNRITGDNQTLESGEALIYTNRGSYDHDTLAIADKKTFKIKGNAKTFNIGSAAADITPTIFLFIPDFDTAIQTLDALIVKDEPIMNYTWQYYFNSPLSKEEQLALTEELQTVMPKRIAYDDPVYRVEALAADEEDFLMTFGGFFFLGILLSIVFLFATVLIIYYKQITEGYEDRSRFEIMQKVGMTKGEIKKSINSQMLTVFILPLFFAVLHLAFAFPMIRRLLMLFNLFNLKLMLIVTGISIAVFTVFYVIVYRITSYAYFKIVSENSL